MVSVRKERIPVRRLKQYDLALSSLLILHNGQKGTNPREGIETYCRAIGARPSAGGQKRTNPREGIETKYLPAECKHSIVMSFLDAADYMQPDAPATYVHVTLETSEDWTTAELIGLGIAGAIVGAGALYLLMSLL